MCQTTDMIMTKSPLRITLGGGGTDLPSYSTKFGGAVISAAISKYVYVNVSQPFSSGIVLKYSNIERVEKIGEIKHPIIRETLMSFNRDLDQIEISTIADIPTGTGLGSSGSFTTALVKALSLYLEKQIDSPHALAEWACDIEINKLLEPIGKQDQYIAAFGGIKSFNFQADGTVIEESLNIAESTIKKLESNLLLFYTGLSRRAGDILALQDQRTKLNDLELVENLHKIKRIGEESKQALESDNLEAFGELMNVHWNFKKMQNPNMTNTLVDDCYEIALLNGAIGGKLVGAGGGGFLMFYASNPIKLRETMMRQGLRELEFEFDYNGTQQVVL